MVIKSKVCILGVNPWQLLDEKTGELKKGVSVYYILETPYENGIGEKRGHFPVKKSFSNELAGSLLTVDKFPIVTDVDMSIVSNTNGIEFDIVKFGGFKEVKVFASSN